MTDRAAIVTRSIMRIVADTHDPVERARQIEHALRDEFADVAWQTASEVHQKED
jgi:hypothetical protein